LKFGRGPRQGHQPLRWKMLRHLVQLFQEAQGPFGVAVLRILAEVNFNAARVFVYVRHQGNLAALFVIVGLVNADPIKL
jgi:hypothetical protein